MIKKFLALITLIVAAFPIRASEPELPGIFAAIYNPDSAVRLAAKDLSTIPPEQRSYIRYLSLYNIPKEQRRKVAEVVSFVVNSLSTRRKMYIPVFVGGCDETLIRLNTFDYEWNPKTWDDLASKGSGPKAQPDPFFHAFLDSHLPGEIFVDDSIIRIGDKFTVIVDKCPVYFPGASSPCAHVKKGTIFEAISLKDGFILVNHLDRGRVWLNSKNAKSLSSKPGKIVDKSSKRKIFAPAPWLHPESIDYLRRETHAYSPILRADWFIVNATLAPIYYEFLRLGDDIKDFERIIFSDDKLAEKARALDKAIVVASIVARNNRTLLRSPTFTGGYKWTSHDSLSSVDDRQYVRNILDEKYDATEDIGTLPNGLQAYFLTDGKGKRLDFANPDIAIDNSAVDRIVRAGRSCIICHAVGINPINDEIRALTKKMQDREGIKLLIVDKEEAYRIADLFSSNLDEQIVKDQNLYAAAVGLATGMRPEAIAKQYSIIYDTYAEKLLNKNDVARELGVSIIDLERYIRLSSDNVVLGLIQTPIRAVRRDQWERSFQDIMRIITSQKGLLPGTGVKIHPRP